MPEDSGPGNWRIIGCSVEGASHKRTGKPNQDRIKFSRPADSGPPVILAVADGHGGKSYFRSDRGAQFAVDTALEVAGELTNFSWDRIKDTDIIDLVCRDIVQKWRNRVNADIEAHPFTDAEEAAFTQKKEPASKRPGNLQDDRSMSYGSTLILAIIHDSYILYLQLGDGNILIVPAEGGVDTPFAQDDRLFGNETTSLCLPESWSDFRFRLFPLDAANPAPALILLSTDGYANSFSRESEFEKVGMDLLDIICEHPESIGKGLDSIEENLPDWLNIASERGSGDDTTVGIICNPGRIQVYKTEQYDADNRKRTSVIRTADGGMV